MKKMIAVLAAVIVVAVAGGILAKTVRKKNDIQSQTATIGDNTFATTDISAEQERDNSFIESFTQALSEATETTKNSFFGKKDKTESSKNSLSKNNLTTTSTTVIASTPRSSTSQATSATQPKTEKTSTATQTKKTEKTTEGNTYAYAYAGFNPRPADLNVTDWTLILVNRDYILPEGFTPARLVNSVTGDSDSKKLDYRVAPHYNDMYQAAKKDGIILETVSGYRSYDLQKNNFSNKIQKYRDMGYSKADATVEAAKIILPPGTSEHNLGFAMDICSLEESFENTKEFRWLVKNAADYGFILRYPKDKQDVTKIVYEPWHWRYVGVDNAKKINDSGLCLEEYLHKVN